MKSYDYEAVVYDGEVFCLGCMEDVFPQVDIETDEEVFPIFANAEWDAYPTCEICHEAQDYVSLTAEGQARLEELEAAAADDDEEPYEGCINIV